jgi:NADH:ubiquinone oxidoreductase subunit 5 (subunit L)/multisubunit Na+/H+ antiporter MnhA subunit
LFYLRSPAVPQQIAKSWRVFYAMSLNKFYLDEVFGWLVVAPTRGLAWLSSWFDRSVIDQLVDAIGRIPQLVSVLFRSFQNGLVTSYVLVMLTGAVACILVVLRMYY